MEINGSEIVTVNDIVRSLEQLNSSIGLYDLQQVSYHNMECHNYFHYVMFSYKYFVWLSNDFQETLLIH